MRTSAILPLKSFDAAKSRLGACLAPALRARLARSMAEDVLDALARCEQIEAIFLVGADAPTRALAPGFGAIPVADASPTGQSAAVALGIEHALAAHFKRVLCVPGDCPALSPADLLALLDGAAERALTIVPDRHGTGTNALLIAPPELIPPSFGAGSFARHLQLARSVGVAPHVLRPASLALDIDTPADLAQLHERASTLGGARRTLALLADAAARGEEPLHQPSHPQHGPARAQRRHLRRGAA